MSTARSKEITRDCLSSTCANFYKPPTSQLIPFLASIYSHRSLPKALFHSTILSIKDPFHSTPVSIPKISQSSLQPKKKKSTRGPLRHAKVLQLATDAQQSGNPVDQGILDRIQKCLARAYHESSSEAEGKAALFLSQKLMSQHNVTQADLILSDKTKSHYGGHSVVQIGRTDGDKKKRTVTEGFVVKLANAMCTFFDCKLYTTDCSGCTEWTFYGIAQNTVAAATAFEMTHNKISIWACQYKGGSPSTSYRLGIADGLVAMANREKSKELQAAKRKELEYSAVKPEELERPLQPSLFLLPSPSTSSPNKLSPFCQEGQ